MKNSLKQAAHQYLYTIILFLIVVSLPYSIKFNSILIILLVLNWFVEGHLKTKLKRFVSNKFALLFAGVFVVYLLGMTYTGYPREGIFELEKKLSLLVFPLILSSIEIERKRIEYFFVGFVATCLFAVIFSSFHYYFKYVSGSDLLIIFNSVHFRDHFTSLFKIHPTYLSLYLALSMLLTLHFSVKYWTIAKSYHQILGVLILSYSTFIVFLLSARMPLIALLLTASSALTALLIQRKSYSILVAILAILILAGGLLLKLPNFNARFMELRETAWQPPVGIYHNSTNLRIGILHCAFEGLKQYWLTGLGTGSVQPFLNSCYKQKGFSDVMYKDNYGLHNAYLDAWLNAGLAGFLILGASLLVPAIYAFRFKNYLYLAFLLFFATCFLTESVLNSQKGVVLFALFNSLLAFYYFFPKQNPQRFIPY